MTTAHEAFALAKWAKGIPLWGYLASDLIRKLASKGEMQVYVPFKDINEEELKPMRKLGYTCVIEYYDDKTKSSPKGFTIYWGNP